MKKAFLRTVVIVLSMLAVMTLFPGCETGKECIEHDYRYGYKPRFPPVRKRAKKRESAKAATIVKREKNFPSFADKRR